MTSKLYYFARLRVCSFLTRNPYTFVTNKLLEIMILANADHPSCGSLTLFLRKKKSKSHQKNNLKKSKDELKQLKPKMIKSSKKHSVDNDFCGQNNSLIRITL